MTATSSLVEADAIVNLLAEVWPDAKVATGIVDPERRDIRAYRMVPSRTRPRLLVPMESPDIAAVAINRVSAADTAMKAAARRILAMSQRHPMPKRRPSRGVLVEGLSGSSIEGCLAELSGTEVRFAMSVGSARANRKPVLNVFRRDGREIGFAKVGLTSLAAQLVRAETEVLRCLAERDTTHLQVPQILGQGTWRGHPLLLMSSLRGTRKSRNSQRLPLLAMCELATLFGVQTHVIRDSRWLAELRNRVEGIGGPSATRLSAILDGFVARHGDTSLVMGSWHGDWGPWNMAWSGNRAQVWDWERCATNVPVGLDAAHFVAHPRLRKVGDASSADMAIDDQAAVAVQRFHERLGCYAGGPSPVEATVHAYLLEVTTRYTTDGAGEFGAPVAGLAEWHLATLERVLGLDRSDS